LQVLAALALEVAVLVSGSRLAAAARAGLHCPPWRLPAVGVGLFGFTEARTTAGIVTGVIEVAAFAALAVLAAASAIRPA
jgi:glycerol kinase